MSDRDINGHYTAIFLNVDKDSSLLKTDVPNYDIYKSDAENDYIKKKHIEHKTIHEEINRVAATDLV